MANITQEIEGIRSPVAVSSVSSTSSLDSFTANLPQHSAHNESSIPPSVSQHSLTAPITSPFSDPLSGSMNQIVNDPLAVHPPVEVHTATASLVNDPLAVHTPVVVLNSVASSRALVPIVPSHPSAIPVPATSGAAPANSSVAEFLYQLTKMLTDDNREVIEWSNKKIEVHNPHKLASDVLHKYFRHSKFASFQRQLNYFGFRKLAGKGKMAPCSYVNDAATSELRSILLIKRKTTPLTGREKATKKRDRSDSSGDGGGTVAAVPQVNPVLAGILQRSTTGPDVKRTTGKGIKHQLNGYLKNTVGIGAPSNNSHVALARSAVGKGIRHSYLSATSRAHVVPAKKVSTDGTAAAVPSSQFVFQEPHQLGMDMQSSLSELSNNFKNSLRDDGPQDEQGFGMLSRDSSLVDLAMLDTVEPTPVSEFKETSDPNFMSFVDFPHQELDSPLPSSYY